MSVLEICAIIITCTVCAVILLVLIFAIIIGIKNYNKEK